MSWSERSVRDHKRQTDRAICSAYARLALYPLVLEKFDGPALRSKKERRAACLKHPL